MYRKGEYMSSFCSNISQFHDNSPLPGFDNIIAPPAPIVPESPVADRVSPYLSILDTLLIINI